MNNSDDEVVHLLRETSDSVTTSLEGFNRRLDEVESKTDDTFREVWRQVKHQSSPAMRFYGATGSRELVEALPDQQLAEKARQAAELDGSKMDPGVRAWITSAMTNMIRSARHDGEHLRADEYLRKLAGPVRKADYLEGSQDSPGTGGYGTPGLVGSEIHRIVSDNSVIYGVARKIPMASNQMRFPSEATAVTTYFTAEGAQITTGEPTQGENVLIARKIAGIANVSTELNEDSMLAVVPYLVQAFGESIGIQLDTNAIEDTGTNFTGLRVNAAINVLHAQGDQTTGQAATYYDAVRVAYNRAQESTRRNSVWICHPAVFGAFAALTDTATTTGGQPVFSFPSTMSLEGPRSMPSLLGYPVILHGGLDASQTKGVGGTGDLFFGDPTTLIYGVNRDIRFGVSQDFKWDTDMLSVKVTGRWGFTVSTGGAWSVLDGVIALS